MKRALSLIVGLILAIGVGAFGQDRAGAADRAAIHMFRVQDSAHDAAYAGGMITVRARHCAKYLNALGARVWDDLPQMAQEIAGAACSADPSTVFVKDIGHNTAINAGISWRAFVLSDAMPGSSGVAKYMALTSDTTAPSATQCAYIATTGAIAAADCALGTGEYTTVGLGRAVGTFAYGGAATYTLDKTWTCSSCSSSVVAAVGIYDRAYGAPKGVLVWWYKFGSSVTLNGSDQIQVTDTITIS